MFVPSLQHLEFCGDSRHVPACAAWERHLTSQGKVTAVITTNLPGHRALAAAAFAEGLSLHLINLPPGSSQLSTRGKRPQGGLAQAPDQQHQTSEGSQLPGAKESQPIRKPRCLPDFALCHLLPSGPASQPIRPSSFAAYGWCHQGSATLPTPSSTTCKKWSTNQGEKRALAVQLLHQLKGPCSSSSPNSPLPSGGNGGGCSFRWLLGPKCGKGKGERAG